MNSALRVFLFAALLAIVAGSAKVATVDSKVVKNEHAVKGLSKAAAAQLFKLTHLSRQQVKQLLVLPQWTIDAIVKNQQKLQRLRGLLALADANRVCVDARDARLAIAIAQLEAVQQCKFNGLPYELFQLLLPRCYKQSDAIDLVRSKKAYCNRYSDFDARRKCDVNEVAPAEAYLKEVNAVCARIGITADSATKTCPDLATASANVAAARAVDCGTGFFTYAELVADIEAAIARINELLNGVPLPSNDPRFLDVPL